MKIIRKYNDISDYIEISESGDKSTPDIFDITVCITKGISKTENNYATITLDRNQIIGIIRDLNYIIRE